MEKKSMEELLDNLANGDSQTKIAVVRRLGEIRDHAAIGALTVAMNDPAENVKIAAAAALGNSRQPEATEVLVLLVRDPKRSRPVQLAAARALAGIGDPRAIDPLIQALSYAYGDASPALVGLGKVAVPPLIEALRSAPTRTNASRVLVAIGGASVNALIDLLRQGQVASERLAAAATLAEIDDPRASDALNEALKEPKLDFQAAVYRYLIRTGHPGNEAPLIAALNTYGKLTMAEDFVASGNQALKAAGEDWARKNQYPLAMRTSELEIVSWGGAETSIKRLGLYHFDNSLASTSGTAPAQSAGVSFVPGKWGSALSVEQGGVLKYPLNGNLNLVDGTIEMWISTRRDGTDPVYSKYNHSLVLYNSQVNNQFVVALNLQRGFYAGTVVAHKYQGAGGGNISSWKPGTWHHIAFTYSSRPTRQRFYVDGAMNMENNTALPDPGPAGDTFTVGCDPYGNWTGFVVDELQISSGAKSGNSIRDSATRTKPFSDR